MTERTIDPGEGGRIEILLVEDNLSDALLIRTFLEDLDDAHITLAQDGIRGCELVEHQHWDLLITDINLPGRDGIAVIQASKEHHPATPIVATSAYTAPAYLDAAFRAGASEVLTKPLEREELLRTVRDLLEAATGRGPDAGAVLAVGALPGDVEAGCGGVLLKHIAEGRPVTILVLSAGAAGEEGRARRDAAVRAAEILGARLDFPDPPTAHLPDLDGMVLRIQNAVHDLEPERVYTPSGHDVRESRQHAFRATTIAASQVPDVFGYQAATTTLDFRPTVFEDISEVLDYKLQALAQYEAQVQGRPHLDPELARAVARYWGRYLGYVEVEPLEVIRSEE